MCVSYDTGHVPVTQGLAMGLAPAPSLLHALVRECRDMSPTLESRVSGPLGRHGVLVWAGLALGSRVWGGHPTSEIRSSVITTRAVQYGV